MSFSLIFVVPPFLKEVIEQTLDYLQQVQEYKEASCPVPDRHLYPRGRE